MLRLNGSCRQIYVTKSSLTKLTSEYEFKEMNLTREYEFDDMKLTSGYEFNKRKFTDWYEFKEIKASIDSTK